MQLKKKIALQKQKIEQQAAGISEAVEAARSSNMKNEEHSGTNCDLCT
jgi:hypothetical protein